MHTVTGAAGYTGRFITARLLEQGHRVQSLTGHPDRSSPFGDQVPLHPFRFDQPRHLERLLRGTDTLFNTYWYRFPRGDRTYARCVEETKTLFRAAREAGVRRVVHVSIAQADRSTLPYFLGKAELERDLISSGLSHAIVRPTVLWGRGRDVLINNIAWCLRRFPVFLLPPGDYGIQPVHVEDLARLAVTVGESTDNMTVDAAGPEVWPFRDLVRLIRDKLGLRCAVLPAPQRLVYAAGRMFGVFLRDTVLTRDEIAGLAAGLCVSDADHPPTGTTRLTEWLDRRGDTLGRTWASELGRHYR